MNKWLPAIAFSVLLLVSTGTLDAFASHYRGGNADWINIGSNTAQFTFTQVWSSSFTGSLNWLFGDGNFQTIGATAPTPVTDLGTVSTSVATIDANGKRYSSTHTYQSSGPFTMFTTTCCRDSQIINGPNTSINLSTDVDFNQIGSTVPAYATVLQFPQGQFTHQLVATDPDSTNISFRLATPIESGGLVIPSTPGRTLSVSPSGVMAWDSCAAQLGLYGISIFVAEGGLETQYEFLLDIVAAQSPPQCTDLSSEMIGGEITPIESTSLILAGAQSFSWMIPVLLSGIGIGLFAVSRKS